MSQLALIWLVSFAVVLLFSVVTLVIVISVPTKGPKIGEYKNPKKAIIVIDVQEDTTGKTARKPFPYANAREFVKGINKTTEVIIGKDCLLIYIKQVFPNRFLYKLISLNRLIEGTEGIELDSGLRLQRSKTFEKTKGDAFSSKKLNDYLIENSVNEVLLAGVDAKACVYKTALGALNRGYKVKVVRNATATIKKEQLNKVLEKFRQKGIEVVEVYK